MVKANILGKGGSIKDGLGQNNEKNKEGKYWLRCPYRGHLVPMSSQVLSQRYFYGLIDCRLCRLLGFYLGLAFFFLQQVLFILGASNLLWSTLQLQPSAFPWEWPSKVYLQHSRLSLAYISNFLWLIHSRLFWAVCSDSHNHGPSVLVLIFGTGYILWVIK